jgi:hypothetical protein
MEDASTLELVPSNPTSLIGMYATLSWLTRCLSDQPYLLTAYGV